MLKFTAYIEYLLMTRHYCYVPGHGAYMLADEPASVADVASIGTNSTRQYSILAPKRTVLFSPLHSNDDGILANLLMEAENMSYDEACRYIARQVPLLSEDFIDEALADTDADNFGFEDLQFETWSDIEARLNPVQKPEQTASVVNADTVAIPRIWLQRAAMILLVIVFFFTNFIGLNNDNAQLASVIDITALHSRTSNQENDADSDDDASLSQNNGTLAVADPAIAVSTNTETAPTRIPSHAKGTRYYIIVASTVSEHEANAICKRYATNGYEQSGILAKKDLFRVFTASFDQKDEALSYLRQLRQQSEKLSKAWLLPLEDESLSYIIKNIYNDNQLSMELSHPNQRTERDQG